MPKSSRSLGPHLLAALYVTTLLATVRVSVQQESSSSSSVRPFADLRNLQQSGSSKGDPAAAPFSSLRDLADTFEPVDQSKKDQPDDDPFLSNVFPFLSNVFGTASASRPAASLFQSREEMEQDAAQQAAEQAAPGNTNLLPEGGTDMIAESFEDSFEDLPEREGQGWMVSREEPTPGGAGRWLEFWRLRADDMEELISPKGYPAERHKVLTRDGFVLTNFRIPYGRSGPGGKASPGSGADRQPVLLIHGISLSSTCWVINDPDESLGFILADEGYDVWMMNTRGNTFSREHAEYEDNNPRFWQFSLDEFARGDLPASISYIKNTTNAKKVHVLGHSQGGTAGLAYLSWKPEAAKDVGVLLAVAPVIYAKYLESPTLVAFSYQANVSFASTFPPQEYLFVSGPMQAVFLGGLCQVPTLIPICTASTESMFGGSLYINTVQYQKYWKVWPSPTSYYNALHWGQIFNEPEPKFMAFNYGPEYDLTKVKAPVVLFTAGRDVLATPKDMSLVRERLASGGSLAGVHESESFGHMDYIWYPDAKDGIYKVVKLVLERYTAESQ